MKRIILILLFLIPSLTSAQLVFANIHLGTNPQNETFTGVIGMEVFATDRLSFDGNFVRNKELTTGTFNANFAVIQTQKYSINPSIGITYFYKPVFGVSSYYQIFDNVHISANYEYIRNDLRLHTISLGLSINLTQLEL